MEFLAVLANFAVNVAAPNEATVALLFDVHQTGLVASAAAHEAATIDGLAGLVAGTTASSENADSVHGTRENSESNFARFWVNFRSLSGLT